MTDFPAYVRRDCSCFRHDNYNVCNLKSTCRAHELFVMLSRSALVDLGVAPGGGSGSSCPTWQNAVQIRVDRCAGVSADGRFAVYAVKNLTKCSVPQKSR